VDVLRDFIFPGDERAFAILGRETAPREPAGDRGRARNRRHLTVARAIPWALLGALILTQICYPLTSGGTRAALTVLTVVLGYLLSVSHALLTRGLRTAGALVATATLGGFAVEAVGVATGFPFGTYDYSGELGPKLLGVPLIIPLAWTWMAWPAWLAALRLARAAGPGRAGGRGLAAWDLFLDPQMVAEGYWRGAIPTPALPGVPGVPIGNYLGWLGFALLLMAALSAAGGRPRPARRRRPLLALWFWTYASSVLAHAVFLGLPASALWGGRPGWAASCLPLLVRAWPDRWIWLALLAPAAPDRAHDRERGPAAAPRRGQATAERAAVLLPLRDEAGGLTPCLRALLRQTGLPHLDNRRG
jgi:putative membrane protein